jgi:hypothetical protein
MAENKPDMQITYHSGSDAHGRCEFSLDWTDYRGRRGQVFHANPREYGFPRPEEVDGKLPERTADTMSDAIALSSPSGRMSKRAGKTAQDRLRRNLFGPEGIPGPKKLQDIPRHEAFLSRAAMLRDLANRGMSARKYRKEADTLEAACFSPPQQTRPLRPLTARLRRV